MTAEELLEADSPVEDALLPRPFRIESVRRETHDVATFALRPVSGSPDLSFAPGQFNMIYLFGVGESAISMCGDPAWPDPLLHTVRVAGVVTGALCKLDAGAVVGVRGPFGRGWPIDEAVGRDLVIVAGGIGMAPLRPVIRHVLKNRESYGRVQLFYGARSPGDLLYTEGHGEWAGRGIEIGITVDHADRSWLGNIGVVTGILSRTDLDPGRTVAMVCGPEIMMRFVVRDLVTRGLDPENVHVSMERNMKCAVGHCGHCQFGPTFVCKDGPVFAYSELDGLLGIREV